MKRPGPIDLFKDTAKDDAEKMPELKHIMETWRNDEEFGRQVCFQGFQKNRTCVSYFQLMVGKYFKTPQGLQRKVLEVKKQAYRLKQHVKLQYIGGFAKLSSADWQPGC